MALDVADTDVLKCNVVSLLLEHPQGIKIGDFSGAFYKLHGHHPQLALHGYNSLRNLLTDMKNMVVLENNSQDTVIKSAGAVPFNPWLGEEGWDASEEAEEDWDNFEEGWGCSEEEMLSPLYEEAEDEAGPDVNLAPPLPNIPPQVEPTKMGVPPNAAQAPAEGMVLITNLLNTTTYASGLQVKKMQELLLTSKGFDLEKFSIAQGYKDTLEFLEHQMPELQITYSSNRLKSVVKQDLRAASVSARTQPITEGQTKPASVLAAALVPIFSILQGHPNGLSLQTLAEHLKKRGFDLECFSQEMGYNNTICCLLEMPGLHLIFLNGTMPQSCVVQLLSSSSGLPAPPLSAGSSWHKPLSSSTTGTVPQPLRETKPAPTKVLTLLSDCLNIYLSGLRVKKLEEFLLTTEGFDLEKFSIAQGYKDTLEFLEHQMPELTIEYRENRCSSVVKKGQGKKKQQKKSQNSQEKMIKSRAKVLALITNLLNSYEFGLRVKKLQEFLLTRKRFDLEKFSIAQGYKDALEFLERQMPELTITYHENRGSSVVKKGQDKGKKEKKKNQGSQEKMTKCPGVKSVLPLPNIQPQVEPTKTVEPPNAAPDFGVLSKPFCREAAKAGPGALEQLPNGFCSHIPVPPTLIPNHPSSKEQHGASWSKDKSWSLSSSDIPAQQLSTCQFGGPSAVGESSYPTCAPVQSKSSLTKPSHSEHVDELKQQVAHILAMHPEGMSLFQFRAAYSTAYQHHLPLGNASSAKQCLLEMSDIVCMKGYGVQTLLLPVSPQAPPTKPGPPDFSKVENAAMVLADSLPKAEVRLAPVVISRPSLLKTEMEPQPHASCPLASDHLREPVIKENCVLPQGQCPTTPKMVAPLQEPVRPKVSFGGHPDSSNTEKAAMNLGTSLHEAAVKIEPVVVPKSSIKPSLSQASAVPVPQLYPSVPSTSTCLRVLGNKEIPSPPESPLPTPPKPSIPGGRKVRAKSMPDVQSPHSPVVFPAEPQVPNLKGNWSSNSFALTPVYLANPSFSVNIPVPSLFQPVLTNIVAMSQPVVHPPLAHPSDTPASPSFSPASYRSVSRTQLQTTNLVSSHPAQPASPNRRAEPTSPLQRVEQTGGVRTATGLDPLQSSTRTQGQGRSPSPGFSADGHPVSSPSVKPPSLPPINSPSVKQPESAHHTWLSSIPFSSVPAAGGSVVAAPSAGVHSKPAAPACQRQYDAVNAPVNSPRTTLSSATHQPASSFRICTESDTVPSKPLVFVPQPHRICVNSAETSSNTQPSTSLHSSRGSPVGTACHPSRVSFMPNTGYDASRQSKPLPGISREGSKQDFHPFALPKKEPTPNSPPRQSSDNCVIL